MTLQVTNKPTRYADGFMLDSTLGAPGYIWVPVLAAASIVKGDIVNDDGNGYFTNTLTAFDATFLGVAAAAAVSVVSGDVSVPVILPLPHNMFWVMNEGTTVAAQTDINEYVDLESNDGVDVTDVTLAINWAFHILGIDVSAEAIAVKTYGYVYGHFMIQPVTT